VNLRVLPAVVAVIFAFAVAMLAFVPFVAREYRRRGELGVTAAAVRSGVLVYLFGLLCYVLLPLPAPDFCSFVRVSPQWMLVSPEETGEQFCLNILLFVPLGMMLRGLGSRGRNTTVLIGFAVSLAIEVTQLTGTWFTYPCPYRVFDVEDLVANTFGTLVGSALVPFARRLATPRGDIPPTVARPITVSRRLLGMSCDGLLLWLLGVIGARVDLTWLRLPLPWQQSVALWLAPALVLLLVTVAGDGSTLGQHAVLVRSVDLSGSPCVRSVLTRWFTGIGGLALLETLANGLALSDTAATGLGVAWCTVHALGVAHQRRGISGWAAGLEVVDTRSTGTSIHPAA
jgi:glycopeptide antibiotics resistance protein